MEFIEPEFVSYLSSLVRLVDCLHCRLECGSHMVVPRWTVKNSTWLLLHSDDVSI